MNDEHTRSGPTTELLTDLIEATMRERLSRRDLIRRALGLGLGLPALTACGGRSALVGTARSVTPATRSAPSATPVPPSATPVPPPTRFAVIGDYGMAGDNEAAVASLVAGWSPEFVISTGDNNYPSGGADTIDANIGQYYHAFIAPYKGAYGAGSAENRFFPVLGNHDWVVGYPKPYLSYFSLPGNGRYYQIDRGPLSFFMLDSMPGEPDGITPNSLQGMWLQASMAASTARWKVVVMHHPPFSSGLHGPSDWMQWPFAAWGARLVLSGHDHSYERIARNDITYVVNGLGGAERYAPGDSHAEGSQIFYNKLNGAMLMAADGALLHMQFVTYAGDVVDDFTLR
jgi:hypothetical protein